jgi:hypothetical protein
LLPNIIEVDDDPFWTIQFAQPDPGLVGVPLRMFIDELASPLDLSKLLAPTVDDPLQFRKLISQMAINVWGRSVLGHHAHCQLRDGQSAELPKRADL